MTSYIKVYLFPDSSKNILDNNLLDQIQKDTETKIKYEYQNATFSEFTAFLNGNYITIDLRYFFPAEKE